MEKETSNNDAQKLKAALSSKLDLLESTPNEQIFWPELSEYVCFIHKTPVFETPLEQLVRKYIEDHQALELVLQKLEKDVNAAFCQTQKVIQKNRIKDTRINNLIERYHSFRDGVQQSRRWREIEMLFAVRNIRDILFTLGLQEGERRISAHETEVLDQKKLIYPLRQRKIWGSYAALLLVPLHFLDFPERTDATDVNLHRLLLFKHKAMSKRDGGAIELNKNVYLWHAHRLNSFLVSYLDQIDEESAKQESVGTLIVKEPLKIKPRPQELPSNDIRQVLGQFSFKREGGNGPFVLRYKNHKPLSFEDSSNLGNVMHVYCYFLDHEGGWISNEDITQHVWPNEDYDSNKAKKLRRIRSDIVKKLNFHGIKDLVFQSAHKAVNTKFAGWFRLHCLEPKR